MVSILDFFKDSTHSLVKKELPTDFCRPLALGDFAPRILELLDLDMTKGPWLAGGAVRKFYLGQNIDHSDFDVWFADQDQFEAAKTKVSSLGVATVFSSDNAISYKYYTKNSNEAFNIQLIKRRFFSNPTDIINTFDFTVCQLVTDGRSLMVGPRTIADIKSRTLRLAQLEVPAHIIPRMVKYMVYGYRPCAELVDQISAVGEMIDWTKPQVEYDAV